MRRSLNHPDLKITITSDALESRRITYRVYSPIPDLELNEVCYEHAFTDSPRAFFHEKLDALDHLVQGLSLRKTSVVPPEIGRLGLYLFEQLFPALLQEVLWNIRHEVKTVLIHSDECWIPWELCKLQGIENGQVQEGAFLCEAFQLSRWTTGPSPRPSFDLGKMAVIVGNDSKLKRTGEEVDFLASLDLGEMVTVPGYKEKVLDVFSSGSYGAIHFVGHGAKPKHRGDHPLLKLKGGQILIPEDITGSVKNLGQAHPLVFFNCCHSGRGSRFLSGAGGWAKALIAAGAGAFIGTLWAVEEQAACTFTRAFFTHLQERRNLSEAVFLAREAVREMGSPHWLAYVSYGDPFARWDVLTAAEPTKSLDDLWGNAQARWQEEHAPVLTTLAVAQEPLSSPMLAFLADVDETQVTGVLGFWRQWLAVHQDSGDCRYALGSDLSDLLVGRRLDLKGAHLRIVEKLRNTGGGTAAQAGASAMV